jgi:NADH:ubiquinone oxidoreductase subunit 2 (subunit N)
MRIANAMFMRQAADAEPVHLSPGMALALTVTGVATIVIGVFPNAFIAFVNWSLSSSASMASAAQIIK